MKADVSLARFLGARIFAREPPSSLGGPMCGNLGANASGRAVSGAMEQET